MRLLGHEGMSTTSRGDAFATFEMMREIINKTTPRVSIVNVVGQINILYIVMRNYSK